MFYLILIITTILFLLLNIKISIQNIKNNNFVKIKLFIFTLHLDYKKVIKKLKRINIKNDIDLKEQIQRVFTLSPLFKDITSQIVVKRAKFNKFFDDYNQIYEITTAYLLSSYFNSFLNFNCKKVTGYKYTSCITDNRSDLDFSFVCKIKILNILLTFVKNTKTVFKYIKRRKTHGS